MSKAGRRAHVKRAKVYRSKRFALFVEKGRLLAADFWTALEMRRHNGRCRKAYRLANAIRSAYR